MRLLYTYQPPAVSGIPPIGAAAPRDASTEFPDGLETVVDPAMQADALAPDLSAPSTRTDFIRALPKFDNHIHGGAFPKSEDAARIALAAARRAGHVLTCAETGTRYDSLAQLTELYRCVPENPTLAEYLRRYHITRDWAATTLADIVDWYHAGARAAITAGCVGVDIRTSIRSGPLGDAAGSNIMGATPFGPLEEFEAIVRGLEAARTEATSPFTFSLTVCLRRNEGRADQILRNIEIVRLADKIRKHLQEKFGRDILRAIDFAGKEAGNKLKHQAPVCEEARRLGFLITAHGGESWHEGGIRHAINNLRADRIGHATALFPYVTPEIRPDLHIYKGPFDKNTALRLLTEEVHVETCLTSNVWTQAIVTRDYSRPDEEASPTPITMTMTHVAQYPHERFVALGGMNLISTDGIYTLGDTDLAQEYHLGAHAFGWGAHEMLVLSFNAIEHSFLDEGDKHHLLFHAWLPFASQIFGSQSVEETLAAVYQAEKKWQRRLQEKHGVSQTVLDWIREQREIARLRKEQRKPG